MSATLLLLGVVAVGVDVGWRELPDGGLEYIIQIDPSQLDSLRDGVPVLSSVPPGARVRSYRIVVGTDALPREGDLLAPTLPHDQGDAGAPVVAAVDAGVGALLLRQLPDWQTTGLDGARFVFPAEALIAGLGVLSLAQVFAHGLELREDVEGTI